MNKINPLYFLALLGVIMLLSFQLVWNDSIELSKSHAKLRNYKNSVKEYNELKTSVSTKEQVLKELDLLVQNQDFIQANIETKIFNNRAVLRLLTNQKKVMQKFVNRMLNKNMKINRMEATKNYIVVEVKL